MPPSFPDLFLLDVRTVLVLLFAGNAALGSLIFLFQWFTAEAWHQRPLRGYALARFIQSLAWLLMLQRGHLAPLLSVTAADNLLLAGLFLESQVVLDLARIARPTARRVHLGSSLAALALVNVVFLTCRHPACRVAAMSVGAGICMALPSVLFIVDSGRSSFRKLLGACNLLLVAVLGARAVEALTDGRLDLFSTGMVQGLTFLLLVLMLALGGAVVLLIAKEDTDRELRELAARDPLTGLSNRRAFASQAHRLLAYHQRFGLDVSMLFIDIDHFKRVNDLLGHAAGDLVIHHLAGVLKGSIREFDLHCRYGGEEFVLLLASSSQAEGLAVAERIREEVAQADTSVVPIPYTVSVGLATSRAQSPDPLADLLLRSDTALYRAKRLGRNRVEVEGAPAD